MDKKDKVVVDMINEMSLIGLMWGLKFDNI